MDRESTLCEGNNIDRVKILLENNGYDPDEIMVFRNFDYETAIVGVSEDGRAVYDFDLMVEYLIETQGWSFEESVEWIDFNTIRALDYISDDRKPIIINIFKEVI